MSACEKLEHNSLLSSERVASDPFDNKAIFTYFYNQKISR